MGDGSSSRVPAPRAPRPPSCRRWWGPSASVF